MEERRLDQGCEAAPSADVALIKHEHPTKSAHKTSSSTGIASTGVCTASLLWFNASLAILSSPLEYISIDL
jgi:hypothetical protein